MFVIKLLLLNTLIIIIKKKNIRKTKKKNCLIENWIYNFGGGGAVTWVS